MKKRFRGRSRIIIDKNGKIKDFFTTASNDAKGFKALQRRMNKERECVPEALVPGMEVTEIAEIPNTS